MDNELDPMLDYNRIVEELVMLRLVDSIKKARAAGIPDKFILDKIIVEAEGEKPKQ